MEFLFLLFVRYLQALRERDTRIAELSQCMSMADVSAMENSFRNELQAARHQFDQQLARLSAELDSERQASVEREREQEAPVVAIEDNGYVVRSQISGILKNVFMHPEFHWASLVHLELVVLKFFEEFLANK